MGDGTPNRAAVLQARYYALADGHNERVTREEALSDIAHALYRRGDDYDSRMPELWQRSGITSSNWQNRADEFVAEIPWLAAYIASLPSEDDVG